MVETQEGEWSRHWRQGVVGEEKSLSITSEGKKEQKSSSERAFTPVMRGKKKGIRSAGNKRTAKGGKKRKSSLLSSEKKKGKFIGRRKEERGGCILVFSKQRGHFSGRRVEEREASICPAR